MNALSWLRLGLAATLLAPGCGPARTLPPEATEPVRIGLIVPLIGELGPDGPGWRDAVVLAVREVNAAGGVLPGRRVELLIEDSESTEEGGVAAYRRLAARGVVAIIGDASSGSTLAIYEEILTSDRPVPLVSGLSTSVELTAVNAGLANDAEPAWFFRTVPPDDQQAPKLAQAMFAEGCRRISILYADNAYGRPFQVGVRDEFEFLGGTVVTPEVAYTEGGTDYSAEVMAVAAQSPDCVALIAYPQSAGVIVNDWAVLPMRPAWRWFGTDGVRQAGFVTEVGNPELVRDFRGVAPLTDQPSPAYNRFALDYAIAFGGASPPAFSSNLYDAAALVMLAIARAGIDDPSAVRDELGTLSSPSGVVVRPGNLAEGLRLLRDDPDVQIDYDGASGDVDLDTLGNVESAYELWRYDADMDRFVQESIL